MSGLRFNLRRAFASESLFSINVTFLLTFIKANREIVQEIPTMISIGLLFALPSYPLRKKILSQHQGKIENHVSSGTFLANDSAVLPFRSFLSFRLKSDL